MHYPFSNFYYFNGRMQKDFGAKTGKKLGEARAKIKVFGVIMYHFCGNFGPQRLRK